MKLRSKKMHRGAGHRRARAVAHLALDDAVVVEGDVDVPRQRRTATSASGTATKRWQEERATSSLGRSGGQTADELLLRHQEETKPGSSTMTAKA